jgi:L-threonylcarbamoyladenylate synthase
VSEWLPANHPQAGPRAAEVIRAGGLVILPTDTVYGVACDLWQADAVAALYKAKHRPPEKAIPILLSDFDAVNLVASKVQSLARRLADAFWPGPLTIAIPKRAEVSEIVSAYPTVGLRIPDHEAARTILRACGGALAVTSANRSGGDNSLTAEEAAAALPDVDLVLDGGVCPGGRPSTVVDLSEDTVRIVRVGAISEDLIRAVLQRQP